jgi:hypothetical protein
VKMKMAVALAARRGFKWKTPDMVGPASPTPTCTAKDNMRWPGRRTNHKAKSDGQKTGCGTVKNARA